MSRNRKHIINKTVLEICFRAEQGLVLPATPLMQAIFIGLLARAQTLYPVTICHFVVMANHVHLLIVVQDPADVPRFMEYLKRESAHAINRILGRDRHTVWTAEYDSPIVLDAEKVIDRIVYFYTNPQQARLVQKIEHYPHLSSWRAFVKGGARLKVPYFPRTAIPRGLTPVQAKSRRIVDEMLKNSPSKHSLVLSPDGWMECFDASAGADPDRVRREIIERIRHKETQLTTEHGPSVVGAKALAEEGVKLDYIPKKRSKKMLCLGSTKRIRATFIAWYKETAALAAAAVAGWLKGLPTVIPPGYFCPGGGIHSNLNPLFSPLPLA